MKFLVLLFLSVFSLFASLHQKSAIVYYGKDISYPMVGIHDYIIVQPSHINTYEHGFKVYKEKMYAYVSIGEIDRNIPEYKKIKKEWILAKNRAWSSDVLDLQNSEYIEFLFREMIEPQRARGFKNFFFDTLDSYQLVDQNGEEMRKSEAALSAFINEFHKRYKDSKLIVNRGFEIIDKIHDSVEAVLFESYYSGIGGKKLAYKEVSASDREWLDTHIDKIQSYGLDVICVDYADTKDMKKVKNIVKKIEQRGMIPYVANRALNIYGVSSKNAIKREIFTLIDESRLDRTLLEAHQHGGLVFEYLGYIQKLHNIEKGLPAVESMSHYAGVVIWLQDYYKHPKKLMKWVKLLKKAGLKIVFVSNFGFNEEMKLLKVLGIKITKTVKTKNKILYKDRMVGYEIEPSLSLSSMQVSVKDAKPLLVYEYLDGSESTPAALTTWGGYAVDEAFMVDINRDNIWVINPFEFFQKALDLKKLIVPDVTTENGKRLLFTHIDGDGIMNRVEGDFGYYSGDVILNKILKVYKIPHSVSLIGAEIEPNGLYPEKSPELLKIAKEMYALENVEAATHTFSHPFIWSKIKNNTLPKEYRLKPKGYEFSLENELSKPLEFIDKELDPKRDPKQVFWSGDCAPQENALEYIYKHNILNINGGDTTITRTTPWLSTIAPLGIERDGYVQVYTGAQNENVFTNDWLGPFWGFKRVTQTFALTNSPRRFKPIDIYYHIYSGSKQASLSALTYVFDWALKQDVMPIFTSEYIPKVMDYYTVSMAKEKDEWLFCGLKNLNTLRVEQENAYVDLQKSKSVVGFKHFETHTYLSLFPQKNNYVTLSSRESVDENVSYLIAANAKLRNYTDAENSKGFLFHAYVPAKLSFHVANGCQLQSWPEALTETKEGEKIELTFGESEDVSVVIRCSQEATERIH